MTTTSILSVSDQKYNEKISRELGNSVLSSNEYHYRSFSFKEDPLTGIKSYQLSSKYQEIIRKNLNYTGKLPLENVRKNSFRSLIETKEEVNRSASSLQHLRIIVISDTHDRHYLLETLPECDILIHAGDIFMKGRLSSLEYAISKYQAFHDWISQQPAKHKIIIGGNHDFHLQNLSKDELLELFPDCYYLCNEGIEIEGLRIFGTPFSYGCSNNNAFQSNQFETDMWKKAKQFLGREREEEAEALEVTVETKAEEDDGVRGDGKKDNHKNVDIVISHGPCDDLVKLLCPSMFYIYGHCHYAYGISLTTVRQFDEPSLMEVASQGRKFWELEEVKKEQMKPLLTINASIMNEDYRPHQLPIVVDCVLSALN
jgi:hypothetical protein